MKEIIAVYEKHGWQLRRLVLTAETRIDLESALEFAGVDKTESVFDALWFSRQSQPDREAWELRLAAETPYALFETFEADETQEQRDEMRQEMEARMREYLKR
ncbi:MAG TPA: hypothetical protein VJT50_02270 [Pyrinomonadaceae bacterium]|nr:hypothetical protein [Pyrinomonadaceae bacterium]